MSSPVDRLAAFIRDNYSSDGWEVAGVDPNENKLWVACPPNMAHLTEILEEISIETGSSADLDLTAEGATLTFWAQRGYEPPCAEVPPPTTSYRNTIVAVVLTVLAIGVATMGKDGHMAFSNNTTDSGQDSGSSAWWGSFV